MDFDELTRQLSCKDVFTTYEERQILETKDRTKRHDEFYFTLISKNPQKTVDFFQALIDMRRQDVADFLQGMVN